MSDLGTTTLVEPADSNNSGVGAGAGAGADAGTNAQMNAQMNVQVDAHSIRARQDARDQITNDVDAYLSDGGSIETLEANLRIDLPRKPQNNYGKGSL